ncbi:hypothetical protein M0813_06682 [Anaeramoeba flamelloides]|uniref:Uncharacterized protein n=1 Tax=Anaeramoeba flamelloides TaxID=1746091 RepID=A0ABQ8XD66_9EUKA|nr:hypothetical protein M0813_06682 [Anaeramoeba flamelloides]
MLRFNLKKADFFKNVNHEQLLVPWFIRTRQKFKIIFTIRVLMVLWTITFYIRSIIVGENRAYWMTYFTHWTWTIQLIYQFLVSVLSFKLLKVWKKHEASTTTKWASLNLKVTKKVKFMFVLWETVFTTTILVTAFFWTLLYKPTMKGSRFNMVTPHGINVIWTLIEFMFNRTDFPLARWIFFVPYGLVYGIHYLIIYYSTGFLPYPVLNPSKRSDYGMFLMVFVLSFLIFCLGKLLAWIKNSHWQKKTNFDQIDNNALLEIENQDTSSNEKPSTNIILDEETNSETDQTD